MQQSMQISLLCSTEHKEESLSLQLTTSYMAAMLKGAQEQNEKEEKLLKLLLPSAESNLTN